MKDSTFQELARSIEQVHKITANTAKNAVNQMLTIRNWIIGYYIVEFEQNGKDRAQYGNQLLENLSNELHIQGLGRLQLNLCRIFYQKYPQICYTVSNKLQLFPAGKKLLEDFLLREIKEMGL